MMRKRKTQKKIFFAAGIAIIIFAAIFISACPIESGYLDKIQEKLDQDIAAGGATEPPAAPSDLQAAAVSTTQIDLTWADNSDNEEEFQIQRKKAGSEDWQTQSVGTDSTTFSDKELDPETEYVYRVRAANAVGESAWTEEVTATTNAVPTYTVTYNGNGNDGGTVPVDGKEYVAGSTVTVSGNTGNLTKSAYAFVGWNTKPDGSGTSYSADGTFEIGAADIMLYAQWDTTFTVTYVGNGSTGGDPPTDTNRYEEGETVNVYGQNTLARTGYTFIEWNTEADGSGIPRGAGMQFSMPAENVTLYAQWSVNEYTVTFEKQSGTGGSDSVTATYGAAMPSATAPTRTWYVFAGYWDATTGGVKYYNADMSSAKNWDKTADTTLYARWADEYNLRDTGPAGGWIFYINPDAETDGWKYLEAAPASTEWESKPWGGYGTEVGVDAQGTAIGTGAANTQAIVAAYGNNEPDDDRSDYAAKLCDDLDDDGYDDWFLPSKDELDLMYQNLHQEGVGGFASANYWSSSELSANYARVQYFANGNQHDGLKNHVTSVRAVRAF